jgi:hypothetical protein
MRKEPMRVITPRVQLESSSENTLPYRGSVLANRVAGQGQAGSRWGESDSSIVGTSTGGPIAMMLGRLKIFVNEAINAYYNHLAKEILVRRQSHISPRSLLLGIERCEHWGMNGDCFQIVFLGL